MKIIHHGIGDIVITTSFPENYYNETGKKIILCDKKAEWAFKYNPYVEIRDDVEGLEEIPMLSDTRVHELVTKYIQNRNSFTISSQAEWISFVAGLDIDNIILRHPRLYKYEDINPIEKTITVHTTGSNRAIVGESQIRDQLGEDSERIMSDEVIETILNNYKDWNIVQIGSVEDKPIGGKSIDLRSALSFDELILMIASSQRFIGVNSGLMHIANCFPKVEKRIMLMEFPDSTLGKGFNNIPFRGGEIRNFLFSWLDPSNSFYNKYTKDIGTTFSYLKL